MTISRKLLIKALTFATLSTCTLEAMQGQPNDEQPLLGRRFANLHRLRRMVDEIAANLDQNNDDVGPVELAPIQLAPVQDCTSDR